MGTGTGSGTETRAVAEMGKGAGTRMGKTTGSERAEERRRSARNRTVAVNPDNLDNNKKAGRGSTKYLGL